MQLRTILYIHHAVSEGGAPTSLALLIAGLDRSEFQPVVLMPMRSGEGKIRELFVKAGADVIEERCIYPFGGVNGRPCNTLRDRVRACCASLLTTWGVWKHTRKISPSLVHINTSVLPFASLGVRLACWGVPIVVHVRETIVSSWWGRMLAALNRLFGNFFIGIDRYGLDKIGATGSNSLVVRNFVDRDRFHVDIERATSFREKMGWSDEQVVFLSLSRVSESNGALELARLVCDNDAQLDPSATFVVAGFSDVLSAYEISTRSIIDSCRRLQSLDFVSDVASLLNACDVVIAPFVSAHSARSVFEGAAVGKPSLVSSMPNLLELIVPGVTGLSYEVDSSSQLIACVNELCRDDVRECMHLPAIEFATKNFDAQRNIESIQGLYRELICPD